MRASGQHHTRARFQNIKYTKGYFKNAGKVFARFFPVLIYSELYKKFLFFICFFCISCPVGTVIPDRTNTITAFKCSSKAELALHGVFQTRISLTTQSINFLLILYTVKLTFPFLLVQLPRLHEYLLPLDKIPTAFWLK